MKDSPTSKPRQEKGVARLIAAWKNSMRGLCDAWVREEAFRLEAGLLGLSVPLSFFFAENAVHIVLLVGSILFLMIVEILNSAIEAVVDRIGLEHHELSRIAKDLGSAAVLLAAVVPIVTWALFLLSAAGFQLIP